jgi:hypothetical protein
LADELADTVVGNFGVSGAGPREYREILSRDVWQVYPDLVLLSIFIGNDITESLPRPRSLDPRHHALYLLMERSWKLAKAANQKPAADAGVAKPMRLSAPPLTQEAFAHIEGRRLAVCSKEPTTAMERKWHRALADFDAIVRSCRSHGVPLRIVLIPDEFQVNDGVLQNALSVSGLWPDKLDLDGPQRRLLAFFLERDVPCLDLLPTFREVPCTYATCDTHWNVAGNHLAARTIAKWLRELKN